MARNSKLLMVEDSLSLAAIYQGYLSAEPVDITHVATLAEAVKALDSMTPDLMLLDIELPDGNGMDLLENMVERELATDVIVMTAHGSSDMAVDAIRLGAFDFLTKPFDASRLKVTLGNALEHRSLSKKVAVFHELERDRYHDFIGHSLAMQSVYRIIDSVAASDATAFIVGESGTGKELAARAIHDQSKRVSQPFLAINCGAIPGELMESELFGHVKGAFTGAAAARDGAASIADGGTLFLDEICEMDLELQKKLLRFIQSSEFQRVGSNKVERVDIRFVCATNKDPLEEVRAGRFREDLYYRLHVIPVELPPLRDRDDDVMAIAQYFLSSIAEKENKAFAGFSDSVQSLFLSYSWPGNVRELENTIQNIVVLNSGEEVNESMLPTHLFGKQREAVKSQSTPSDATQTNIEELFIEPLWQIEKRAIEAAISHCSGNVNRAAALLEVAPSTLYRKIQSWKKTSS